MLNGTSCICDMRDFLKWILRATPVGFGASSLSWLLNKIDGGSRSNWISDLGNDSLSDMMRDVSEAGASYLNTVTQQGPTGRDLWVAEREDTLNQRTVNDLTAAGLNSALMYGSSGNQPSINTSSSGAGVGISELLQLAMLPLQMKSLQADINKTNAEANNINQRTMTEEQETALKALMVQYYPEAKQAEIDNLIASLNVAYSQVNVNDSNASLIHSQDEAQQITNDYLTKRQEAELSKIAAEAGKVTEQEKFYKFHALFEQVQYQFAKDNGFLMSSSDTLMVAMYIANLLGLDTKKLQEFFTQDAPKMIRDVVETTHLGTPGGPHK